MSAHKTHPSFTDPDRASAAPQPVSVQITFRHLPTSPALAAHIEKEVQKLRRFCEALAHCHVVIVAPHQHHLHGHRYAVHLELGIPGGPLVVNHEPASKPGAATEKAAGKSDECAASHTDIYVVLRDAFDVARRQLEDYVRRKRDDVKRPHLEGLPGPSDS